ncbi:GNAT family N-acetyltransferase [Terrabacter sp. Ter38]|uniref:GNAT family N-acetyltransferase n=1 Tax=Terrabacter sp. Ter38 TaxID=2926030 RepID=UPI002118993D|nr:GNAT family N-acetyltransferase [Terrabacter sp. Ter38]
MPDAREAIEPPETSGPLELATVRDATPGDATACAAIYAPYVTDTAITFETEVPDVAAMAARIETAQRAHAWLVLEDATGAVVGYAYAGPFKERAAYRWSCEVSVYLAGDRRGRGGGRRLYEALLERLTARGYRMAAAGMTQPNEASGRLHAAMGFAPVGTYRDIGWKFGASHDVTWVQRRLGEPLPPGGAGENPPEPT